MKKHIVQNESDWSEEVIPKMDGYRMACCDCGLVHNIQFVAIAVQSVRADGQIEYHELDTNEFRVKFRVQLNKRSTAQIRRHMRVKA